MRGRRRLNRYNLVHEGILAPEGSIIKGADGFDLISNDCEIPNYGVNSMYFSIKVNYDGDFDEGFVNYFGGKIEYFDMCSMDEMPMSEINAMLTELGILVDYSDLWFRIPDEDLPHGLLLIETPKDLSICLDLLKYTKLIEMYTTPTIPGDDDLWEFSFTQFALDENQSRIDDIIQECDTNVENVSPNDDKWVKQVLDDEVSFQGDSSNVDSSESESEKPNRQKKQKKAPLPPNPSYRARKKGKFTVLIGLNNNKVDTPLIVDDDGPSLSHPSQQEVISKQTGSIGIKKTVEVKATDVFTVINVMEENRDKDDGFSSDSKYNSDEERMAISSCDEDEPIYPEFNEITDMSDPQFQLGMLFVNGAVFRAAVRKHAIVHQRPVRLRKNLGHKIKWICSEGCPWKVYAAQQQRSKNFQIRTLNNLHTCNPTWEQKQITSTWIANAYEADFRMNPTWPIHAFHSKVVNDLRCGISESMIYRAMRKAKENIVGKHEAEFAKLYDYGNEILKIMPTSTVKIMTEAAEQGVEGGRFKRFYVCLGPLKDGFMSGCRPLIGVDGCHLKGPLGGILLTAVATDPNDGMYPVAWAQVEAENNNSWHWFLGLLKTDLRIENSGGYTFISDRQKGLVNALEAHFSAAEHRFCTMHMYNNLPKEFKGLGVKRLVWSAAKSTSEYWFKKNMDALKKISPRAYQWLEAKPRSQWSRSAFRELCKSDMFVNNICEVFNNAINNYRDMGIVTMFKSLHNSAMERIQKRKTNMEKKKLEYCPNAMKRLKKSIAMASKARPIWNGGSKYHVTMMEGGHEIVVDLEKRTCACRKWELTGIPCFHACACIFFKLEHPVNYIHPCYKKQTFIQVYSNLLEPMNGEPFWEMTDLPKPLPPMVKSMPGRPKKKRDKKNDVVETREHDPTMLKRTGTSLRCSYCSGWGHNNRTCNAKKHDKAKKYKEAGASHEQAAEGQAAKPVKRKNMCSHCEQLGHTTRSCKIRKLDEEREKVEKNSQRHDEIEPQKNSAIQLEKRHATDVPRHAGIINPFRPPVQAINRPILGISAENYTCATGQQYTSLRKLQEARKNKQQQMKKGKEKM